MTRVLLTGYSGFLGSYIHQCLIDNGYEVITVGRSQASDIQCDLSKETFTVGAIDQVIHVAGKAHSIPKNEEEASLFIRVNVEGTENLLKSVKGSKISSFVFISSVAVYGLESGELIDESVALKGKTPYALSKIKAEQLVRTYAKEIGCKHLILRLPLITGRNSVGNLKSMENAIKRGYYFRIGAGLAKKSVISARDVARFMPKFFELDGTYNLTDSHHPTVAEIDECLARRHGKRIKSMPNFLLKLLAKIGDTLPFFPINTQKIEKLSFTLTFSNERLFKFLKEKPRDGLKVLNEFP